VRVGNAHYNCSCVRYVIIENFWLVFSLSLGFGIIFIIVIIIIITIVVVSRKRRTKPTEERSACDDNGAGSMELTEDDDDGRYCTIPAAEAENSGNTYCSPGPMEPDANKEYSALSSPEATDNNSPYYLSLRE